MHHGLSTTTFNAAGVHNHTLFGYGVTPNDARNYVDAYYVGGEILSTAQDQTGFLMLRVLDITPDAIGIRRRLVPDLSDNNWWNPLTSIDLHSMEEVIEAIEKKIDDACCDE